MTREEAIQILSTRDAHGVLCGYTSGVTEALDMAIETLSAAEPKTGEWIDEDGNNVPLNEDGYPLRSCYCNQCYEWLVGSDEYETKGNFCPNCGARMLGEDGKK